MNAEALLKFFGKNFPILSLLEIADTCFLCKKKKKKASFSDYLCYCYENILGNISTTLITVCNAVYLCSVNI